MNIHRFAMFAAVLVLLVAPFSSARTPQSKSDLPVVKSAEMPFYPPIARMARIEGTAHMRVWTDGASIVKVQGSGAHKMLMDAAEENLRTWRFHAHKPTSFTVTFVYGIERDEVFGSVNPSIISIQLPVRVEIRTKSHPVATIVMQ